MITQSQLKEILEYNPETGIFIWLESKSPRIKIGQPAGSVNGYGYHQIKIDNKIYLTHRLIWFYMTGRWPENEIDHKNNIKTDNRRNNLREATRQQNGFNQKKKDKGISWEESRKKWKAGLEININGKRKCVFLGRFNQKEEALTAYNKAALKYFGEYAKLNDI